MPFESIPLWRYGAIYGALFAMVGVNLPFLPVWLAARGLDAGEIGLVIGAPIVLRILIAPLVAEVADRSRRPVAVLRGVAALAMASYVLLAAVDGFWPLLAANALAQACAASALPLFDSLAVRRLAKRPGGFGRVRLWGSLSFIAANLVSGVLIGVLPVASIVWMVVGLQFVTVATAIVLVRDTVSGPAAAVPTPPTRGLMSPGVAVIVLGVALIQGSHGAIYGLGSLHWRDLGLDAPTIGALWAMGVAAEVTLFFASARLPAWIGPRTLMGAGAAAAVVRWLLMGLDPVGVPLLLLQCLHAFSFAATYLGMVAALAAAAAPGAEARAQAAGSTAQGVALAGAIALAGQLYPTLGAGVFPVMAGLAAFGGAVIAFGPRLVAKRGGS
ncbi:MFS transporter [Blastochloris viridis]|uniref:Probable 3-phenylpropionic acid transporter n=1 Tax=Blastochloris viridis TaxID=1079 RepID=A0A0H5B706_BLAVI|nr:MFS transporter [Blastochloris viridis]ALK08745.1 putative 3-phenylpropionic acid transporter [Blastochloris viridis]BAR97960.1 probable 3-phenylpropionic acid transporter [Blastochloris viridis]CUU41406.1 putative 3-phenylpropionic acid transporter [Blastochloris viridis]